MKKKKAGRLKSRRETKVKSRQEAITLALSKAGKKVRKLLKKFVKN